MSQKLLCLVKFNIMDPLSKHIIMKYEPLRFVLIAPNYLPDFYSVVVRNNLKVSFFKPVIKEEVIL